jgi:hypothetical protein
MELEFTKHALHALQERAISIEWVERTVGEPELRESDANDPLVERFYRRIPENGNRTLRVAVNTRVVFSNTGMSL